MRKPKKTLRDFSDAELTRAIQVCGERVSTREGERAYNRCVDELLRRQGRRERRRRKRRGKRAVPVPYPGSEPTKTLTD